MEFKFKIGIDVECKTPPPPAFVQVPVAPDRPADSRPHQTCSVLQSPENPEAQRQAALKRGEMVAGAIVVVICAVQVLPDVWKVIESSPPAQFLRSQIFKKQPSRPAAKQKSKASLKFIKFPKGSILAADPKRGERIAGYRVASPFGWRPKPCAVCSNWHNGADVVTPMGTPLYAIALPGQKIEVTCKDTQLGGLSALIQSESVPGKSFAAVHLSACYSGTHKAGKIFALTGNSGQATTGPHLHWVEKVNGEAVPPQRGYVEWTITGSVPDLTPPTSAQKKSSQHGHFAYQEADRADLVAVGGGQLLHRDAAAAFDRMAAAARKEGVNLVPLSGFRDKATQHWLFFGMARQRGQTLEQRARVSAPPGHSEHHTGYAVDVGDENAPATNLNSDFEKTEAFEWMQANAVRYSFELSFLKNNSQGISYEPWHWRFVGSPKSRRLFKS